MLLIGCGVDSERTIAFSASIWTTEPAMPSSLQTQSTMTANGPFHCLIDASNGITLAFGDAGYLAFNGSADDVPSDPIGKRLENIVCNLEVRAILRCVLNHVRMHSDGVVLPYRYDEPGFRRYCEMTIARRDGGELELSGRCRRTRARNGPPSSWKEAHRRAGLVRICSVCDRCELAHDDWCELPEAMTTLRLLERRKMPGISHVLCPRCYVRFTDGLDRPDA